MSPDFLDLAFTGVFILIGVSAYLAAELFLVAGPFLLSFEPPPPDPSPAKAPGSTSTACKSSSSPELAYLAFIGEAAAALFIVSGYPTFMISCIFYFS